MLLLIAFYVTKYQLLPLMSNVNQELFEPIGETNGEFIYTTVFIDALLVSPSYSSLRLKNVSSSSVALAYGVTANCKYGPANIVLIPTERLPEEVVTAAIGFVVFVTV